MSIRKSWLAVIAALAALTPARAQEFPTRPIMLVIPFAPGGSTSIVGRGVARKMSELLGEKIVVDNRPGAGGTLGTRAVAKSEPDGYTLLLGYTGTLAIGPSLYKNAGYDPRKDFAPVGMIGNAPNSLVVNPSFPAKTLAELIAHAKANPGKVNFGSAGAGTASHITGEYFARSAGITLVHVPYKGTGPVLTDLIGGHIPMAFAPIPASHSNVAAGKLRALAVTSTTRSGLLPDIPTIAESGIAGFPPRVGEREDAMHPVGLHRLQRRGAGRNDAAPAFVGRVVGQGDRAPDVAGRQGCAACVHHARA